MSALIDEVKGWFAKAESDLKGAVILSATQGPFDIACFHCQQTVEKYMKGFLISVGVWFPFTHDLSHLAELCVRADATLDLRQPEIVDLTVYGAKGRYDKLIWPTQDEAQRAVAVAQRVRDLIRSKVPAATQP